MFESVVYFILISELEIHALYFLLLNKDHNNTKWLELKCLFLSKTLISVLGHLTVGVYLCQWVGH